jgi:hypothetical protein
MKKIILICAFICVGQIYGMEREPQFERFSELPIEAKAVLISVLSEGYDNVGDAVKAIQAMSRTNKELNKLVNEQYGKLSEYDLKRFIELVHILADKFDESTLTVAGKFKTPISEQYKDLFLKSLRASCFGTFKIDTLTLLIEKGLDVNGTFNYDPNRRSLLIRAVDLGKPEMVKLFLEAGADPHYKDAVEKTALDYAREVGVSREIIELLQKAMDKQ